MTTAEEARQQVAELEEQLGFTLREWPVAHLDQWTAHLRDLAGQLDVDLTDPQQAHAAFTGAYMLFAVMLAGGPMMYGIAKISLLLARGETPKLAQLFDGFGEFSRTLLTYLLRTVFILLWSLVPVYWAVNASLQTGAQITSKPAHYLPPTPTIKNYISLLSGSGELPDAVRRSSLNIFIECGVATIVTVVLSTLAAYAFARMTFRGRNVLFYGVLATMAFPAYTTLIPLYQILTNFGLVNTYTGIILVYVSGFLPLATWILYNYMSSLPVAIEEAGQVDGASRMQVLWHVVIPLARPGIISTAIITFLFAWGQFLFPLVLSSDLSTQPLTVVIAALQGRHVVPFTLLSAAGVLAMAVPAVIAVTLNKYIVSGLLTGSVK